MQKLTCFSKCSMKRYSLAIAAALLIPSCVLEAQQIPDYLLNAVYTWSPLIIAETHNLLCGRCSEQILPINFDGDWDATNNSSNAGLHGDLSDTRPTVYFSAVESGTSSSDGYYFLGYYFYHANDAGINCCVKSEPHENDLEGAFFVVKKDPYVPQGQLYAALTQAHGALFPYFGPSNTYLSNGNGGNNLPCCNDAGHIAPWVGVIHVTWVWWDANNHPIVILRGRDHAAYMASNCGNFPSVGYQSNQYGWYPTAPSQGTYAACVHNENSHWMMYVPEAPGSSSAVAQPWDAKTGQWDYNLVEIALGPFWHYRMGGGPLYTGNMLTLVHGQDGFEAFASSPNDQTPKGANPPWQWTGGQGCHIIAGSPYCWYDFSDDNTVNTSGDNLWFPYRTGGALLIDPNDEISHRFRNSGESATWLPQLNLPYIYDPYGDQPQPPPPPSLTASIDGPDYVFPDQAYTWTAIVSNGVAPYSYQWSGPFSGSGSSITGSLNYADTIFLTVYDATGASVTVSKPVTVCYDGTIPCSGT